jgi:hypothetical protein
MRGLLATRFGAQAWEITHQDGTPKGRRLRCDPNIVQVSPHAEYIKQPKDYHHHHHNIEDLFDLPIHGDVGVDEPE